MIVELDAIKFESRSEIRDIMEAIEEYRQLNPTVDNVTINRLYDLLDVLDLSW